MMPVAPGVHWIRMPIPIPGLQFINLWAVEDEGGWTLIDTGLRSRRIQAYWEQIFAGPMAGRPVVRIICTHFHPDHLGLAGWIAERFRVPLWMTLGEWSFGRAIALDERDAVPDDVMAFYRRLGFDEAALMQYRERGFNNYRQAVYEIPNAFHRMVDGDTIRIGGHDWTVMVGRGHAPEHACLYCADLGLLISGDQILPRITPHIGVYPTEPDGDPLRLYLASLPTYRPLPADTFVLPSHNDPFRGLHLRLDQLAQHHEIRLAALMAACGQPKTVLELLPVLFRRELDTRSKFMAVGEGLAHLHCLMAEGRMKREVGADGVLRYQSTARAVDAA
ncbi:MAG TPA: MBL fold metallo-hydrolase [Candidatus Cybelea sp.]|nr:MBL fold metallo-hydrolase [Candidatus Cybelea sp.]